MCPVGCASAPGRTFVDGKLAFGVRDEQLAVAISVEIDEPDARRTRLQPRHRVVPRVQPDLRAGVTRAASVGRRQLGGVSGRREAGGPLALLRVAGTEILFFTEVDAASLPSAIPGCRVRLRQSRTR